MLTEEEDKPGAMSSAEKRVVAIVFASGQLAIGDMIRKGVVLNLVSTVVITLLCYSIVAFLW
ncbi:hypothetical protein [Kushneria aurantia]|uniref:Uncharacterized protein n=1 Tax=Kushneria aurantia TaxID=504092 RepID=A0ABV6G4B4_9GAMM|nr:hypothetical protein [Kushneria aurantia]